MEKLSAQQLFDNCEAVTPEEAELLFPEADFSYMRNLPSILGWRMIFGVDPAGNRLYSFIEYTATGTVYSAFEWTGEKKWKQH